MFKIFNKSILFWLSIFFTLFFIFSCKKIDPEVQKEIELVKETLVKAQTSVDKLEKEYKAISLQHIEKKTKINNIRILLLSSILQNYAIEKKHPPKTEKEFEEYLLQYFKKNSIPKEVFSGSANFTLEKNNKGGWWIDNKKLLFKPN